MLGLADRPGSPQKTRLKLHCVLTHKGQADKWSDSARERYHSILEQADTVDYVSRDYYDGCMIDRNHRLVDSPALLLAVYNGMRRIGTSATVNYARKMGLEIIVIGPITRHITHEEAAPSLANLWRCILCCNLSARMCRNQRPQGAEKPRRQACSTGRRASASGLGGTPTSASRYRKRYPDALLVRDN